MSADTPPNNPEPTNDPDAWRDDELLRLLIERYPVGSKVEQLDKIVLPEAIKRQIPSARLWRIVNEFQQLRATASATGAVDVLALRLAASGRPVLLNYIRSIGEFPLTSAHRVTHLIDFGAESLVFAGQNNNGNRVAIKIPFLDFTNLAKLDVEQLLRRRRRLVHEGRMLRAMSDTFFPAFISEYITRNPFFPSRIPPFLRDSEQFLVLEYLNGIRVDAVARILHEQKRECCVLRLTAKFAATFFQLSMEIPKRIELKATYTDIKPENALLQDSELRIVDASSIVFPSMDDEERSFCVSEAYLDPIDHFQWRNGSLALTPALTIRSVVRCAHRLAANMPLLQGQANPPWPMSALSALGPTLDALSSTHDADLGRCADVCQELLHRLTCNHGSGSSGIF
jgi:hypothetical protein